jgi:hypothetical protein
MKKCLKIIMIAALLQASAYSIFAQGVALDNFETIDGWSFIKSDGVEMSMSVEPGIEGNAIRFDYDFTKGTGYGGIQKWFPIELPVNYQFTFYIKAESPANNFEVKFLDQSGDNVWWVNNRNYDFPNDWQQIRIRPRHIEFAWGPISDRNFKRVDRIEFTIASFLGGKGTIWIDGLRFEPLDPEPESYPPPDIIASSSAGEHLPLHILDKSDANYWQSRGSGSEYLLFDFGVRREFGGIQIEWGQSKFAKTFKVLLSEDAINWQIAYEITANQSDRSFLWMPESEARYLKLEMHERNAADGFSIQYIDFLNVRSALTKNDFLMHIAANSPSGDFPRYFLDQASYWTISGVNNDAKEAMINEDGMVEVDKALFSIEPMIMADGTLFNWNNVHSKQSLNFDKHTTGFQFMPSVEWNIGGIEFITGISTTGEANISSQLNIGYAFKNLTDEVKEFELYLLIRPFQVNPHYQFLNLEGGAGTIHQINESEPGTSIAVDQKRIYSLKPYDEFGAIGFNQGQVVDLLRNGRLPDQPTAYDRNGMASGYMKYAIRLQPREQYRFYVVVPFYDTEMDANNLSTKWVEDEISKTNAFWEEKTSHISFNLPSSAYRILKTYRSNLVYILMNRDRAGIQPGSRSYERSWIRDGSLTSSALLKSGIVEEVRDFTAWYAAHQFENGKVPCVVDFRGPDPVPEHDSHGQLIYLIREYFNFTRDTAFLHQMNSHVLSAVNYIESLIAERSTDHFKYGNDSIRAYYGIVPESISHEGYSEKPMHSYWDNFFIIKGLKDAVEIQRLLENEKEYIRMKKVRDTFSENLYNSLRLAMKTRGIDYLPGCVELGDFDATSTTIALTPCNELKNLPKPEVYNTFEQYFKFFQDRRDGKRNWTNYTPYENRLIGSYIILDQPERAHELIEYFLNDLRPQHWYHWAEVVWKDYRMPRFIGDMPHTWVGSDFINSIRSMFVYENEYDHSLVLAAALYQDWIDAPDGMSVENMPTYYGNISYFIKKQGGNYHFNILGDLDLPENGMKIRNFNGSQMPDRVNINGRESKTFTNREIIVDVIPAEVMIYY